MTILILVCNTMAFSINILSIHNHPIASSAIFELCRSRMLLSPGQTVKASTIHTTMLLISVALSLTDQLSTTAPPSNISYLSPVGSLRVVAPHLKMEIGGDDSFAHQSITGLTRKKTFGVQSLGIIILIRISTSLNAQPLVCFSR